MDFIAWLNRLGLSKIGNKVPLFFRVWQIFWGQRKHKNFDKFLRKNSWNECFVSTSQHWIGWPSMSAELSVNLVDNALLRRGFLTIFLTIWVRLKSITIFVGFLFHRFHLLKWRYFAFSRIFDWVDEKNWRNFPQISHWTLDRAFLVDFCVLNNYSGWSFFQVSRSVTFNEWTLTYILHVGLLWCILGIKKR